MKQAYIFFIAIFILMISCGYDKKGNRTVEGYTAATKIDTTGSGTDFLKHLHKKRTLKTYDQSLEKYLSTSPLRPDSIHKTIYLLPIGDLDSTFVELLDNERKYLRAFFQLDVTLLPSVALDDLKAKQVKTRQQQTDSYGKGSFQGGQEQVEANSLIKNYIAPNKPKDAVVVLGVTQYDIYNPGYNFIFGISDLHKGTGIVSLHRLRESESTRNVMAKQIANLFSIPNTKDYDCLLNYHNSAEEQAAGVSFLSPLALQKLKLAIGFDYKKRFEELEEFWKGEGHTGYQKYYHECLKGLNAKHKS